MFYKSLAQVIGEPNVKLIILITFQNIHVEHNKESFSSEGLWALLAVEPLYHIRKRPFLPPLVRD